MSADNGSIANTFPLWRDISAYLDPTSLLNLRRVSWLSYAGVGVFCADMQKREQLRVDKINLAKAEGDADEKPRDMQRHRCNKLGAALYFNPKACRIEYEGGSEFTLTAAASCFSASELVIIAGEIGRCSLTTVWFNIDETVMTDEDCTRVVELLSPAISLAVKSGLIFVLTFMKPPMEKGRDRLGQLYDLFEGEGNVLMLPFNWNVRTVGFRMGCLMYRNWSEIKLGLDNQIVFESDDKEWLPSLVGAVTMNGKKELTIVRNRSLHNEELEGVIEAARESNIRTCNIYVASTEDWSGRAIRMCGTPFGELTSLSLNKRYTLNECVYTSPLGIDHNLRACTVTRTIAKPPRLNIPRLLTDDARKAVRDTASGYRLPWLRPLVCVSISFE